MIDDFFTKFDGRHLLIVVVVFVAFIKGIFRYIDLENEVQDLRRRLGR